MVKNILNLVGLACGVGIGGLVTLISIDMIVKVIATKKYGEMIEATVVKVEEVNAKGNITYIVYCEFEYNGRIIQKSEGGMSEKHSKERYIGKKYNVLYHPKYDYMVIEQEYKKILHGAIIGVIIPGGLALMCMLAGLNIYGII